MKIYKQTMLVFFFTDPPEASATARPIFFENLTRRRPPRHLVPRFEDRFTKTGHRRSRSIAQMHFADASERRGIEPSNSERSAAEAAATKLNIPRGKLTV